MRFKIPFLLFLSMRWVKYAALLLMGIACIGTAIDLTAKPSGKKKYNPPKSYIVIDFHSGHIIQHHALGATRHPASLTKMMTLYLLFDAIDKGKTSMNDRIKISANATKAPPSKLGLAKGQSITVKRAIDMLIVKSANDIAIAVAEHVSGSVPHFVARMNVWAQALGMYDTKFYNPHGLPHKKQITTARDMVLLSSALMRHFPHYFKKFSTQKIRAGKRILRNHNRLLTKGKGVDGIKTGYIKDSGYNLALSAIRDGNRVIAIYFGGKTSKERNDNLSALVDASFREYRFKKYHTSIPEKKSPY